MSLPFKTRIASQDWHPKDHISFASNHSPPDNKPFESTALVPNPENPSESERIVLWPDHCIQDTTGAALITEFDTKALDHIIKKGQDRRVEMYSAFKDTYEKPSISQSGLGETLRNVNTTHVYVVGLAMDYCVKWTAMHAAKEGWETFLIEEATRAVDPSGEGMARTRKELEEAGVKIVSIHGEEVGWVKNGKT